jgi:hypothetical protein
MLGRKRVFVHNLGTSQAIKVPAMAQAVNRRHLTTEVHYRSWASACENYVGKLGTGTGLSLRTYLFLS